MNCIYFDKNLQTTVPCSLVPNFIKAYDDQITNKRIILCKVIFDEQKLQENGLSMNQILKYCAEYINIHDLYPNELLEEIDYYNNCLTNKTVDVSKELKRYKKLYQYIANVAEISADVLYCMSNLFITDLQFKFLNHQERLFMLSLSSSIFVEVPEQIPVIDCIIMLLNLFDKYTGNLFTTHIVENYNNYTDWNSLFPLELNVENIKTNLNLIRDAHPELF